MSITPMRKLYDEYLKMRGEALTEERKKLLQSVFDIHNHFTVEELSRETGASVPSERLEEILFEMVEAGLIRKVFFGTGRLSFEHVYGHVHHDHLFCLECGKIEEFRDDGIETRQNRIAAEKGFHVLRHSLQIIGLCEDCFHEDRPQRPEYIPSVEEREGPQVPLSLIRNGESAILVDVKGGRRLQQRLAAMGLVKGCTFKVVSNSFSGPVTIRVKETTLAIGHKMSHKIFVRLANAGI